MCRGQNPSQEFGQEFGPEHGRDSSQNRADRRTTAIDSPVRLLYYGFAPVSVRGPISGRLYQFSRLQPILPVDARDAVSILKTRLFRQIR